MSRLVLRPETLLCDRIHDDYTAAIPSKKQNKLPQIYAPTTSFEVALDGVQLLISRK